MLFGMAAATGAPVTQIFVAGDSTAAYYEPQRYPQLGWAMVLKCAFDDSVVVHDYAKGGRSAKSFATQGFLAQIAREIGKGDTLLIQFGHNDSKDDDPVRYTDPKSDYRTWLLRYVELARSKGAQPIFITPVTRRQFKDGVLVDTHAPYAQAMREVARESHTPLIDLTADSMRWVSSLGDEGSKPFYLVFKPGQDARFPDGHVDNTHFTEMGARKVAELVAERLAKLDVPLAKRVKSSRPGLARKTALGGPSCDAPFTEKAPPLLAFPGAEGAGRYSLGGRRGRVLKVTNLNDSGPGSFRAAVEAEGPRTIIFDVGGTIALESPLHITHGRVTIAGQTAPGDGLTLRNYTLHIAAGDVILRYLRSRLGDTSGQQDDAISVDRGRRVILDHVSASWSVDETLSVSANYKTPDSGPYDVTVQWSIIAESLNASVHDKGKHGYGSLIRGGRGSQFSFHHNLWASHLARMPRPGNYTNKEVDPLGAFFDFRNNIYYNWGGDASGYNADTTSLASYNFVGNAYVPGPDTKHRLMFKEDNPFAHAYFADNSMDGEVPSDQWSLVTGVNAPGYHLAAPVAMPPVTTESAEAAYRDVLRNAGVVNRRDAVDLRILAGVKDRTHHIINSEADVGGWPVLASGTAAVDTDGDGMPDEWEKAHGFDPNRADGNNDQDGNGYTNLEEYLNDLATRPLPTTIPTSDSNGLIAIAATGKAFDTLQSAVDALPETGGEITLATGVYREKVSITKPHVRLQGVGSRPQDVVIVWSDANATVGGTVKSATLTISGDDFRADNLTVQNDYSLRTAVTSQAVALAVTGDRDVFTRVRLLGAQDTLYAATKKCDGESCAASRQYFRDCYIEGHVDFIFGDAKALFERCEIHAIAHAEVMLTAHSRTSPEQDRAYVFVRCRITADEDARDIYLGRPWRDYAAVIFMNTNIEVPLNPAGWSEWHVGETHRLDTAYYAEYRSSGSGANVAAREPRSHQLTDAEAQRWSMPVFLAGADAWTPDLTR